MPSSGIAGSYGKPVILLDALVSWIMVEEKIWSFKQSYSNTSYYINNCLFSSNVLVFYII